MANENKKELPMWKRIKQGDKLPCQSFLRKKDGEILRLTTFGGVEVGQDCYYIPVDEVVNVIKDYPVEESEGEKIRKDIVEAVELHKDFTQERKERIYAWLEKQGEPVDINPSEFDLRLNKLLKQFESLPKEELASSLSFYLNVVQNDGSYKEEKQGEQNRNTPVFTFDDVLALQCAMANAKDDSDEELYHALQCLHDRVYDAYSNEKQGEQKPTDLPKGEDYGIDGLYAAVDILQKTLGKVEGYQTDDGILEHECAISAVKDLSKQKSAEWSEEDEKDFNTAIQHIENYVNNTPSSQRPEIWADITKLKSLRPQSTWKPSKEQMEALKSSTYCQNEQMSKVLFELYQDLKKLREE